MQNTRRMQNTNFLKASRKIFCRSFEKVCTPADLSRSCSIIHTIMRLAHYEFFSVNYNLPGRFCKKFGPLKLLGKPAEIQRGYSTTVFYISTNRQNFERSTDFKFAPISPAFLVRRSPKFISRILTLGRIDSSQKNQKIPLR